MSKIEHTPGPWNFQPACALVLEKGSHFYRIEDSSDGFNIGLVSTWRNDPEDAKEAEANARLIAAAPDLLQALENLVATYSEPDDRVCCNGVDCGCFGVTKHQEAEHYAREAIAKARGDQ